MGENTEGLLVGRVSYSVLCLSYVMLIRMGSTSLSAPWYGTCFNWVLCDVGIYPLSY